MSITDLGEHLRTINADWDDADAEERAVIWDAYKAAGWVGCNHPDCPPWDCRVTNPKGAA